MTKCCAFSEFGMDHSIYLPYSSPNGVPQESKLATYMVRLMRKLNKVFFNGDCDL